MLRKILFWSLILLLPLCPFAIRLVWGHETALAQIESSHQIIVGAHRGASLDAPENTLPALAVALESSRFEFLEFDVQLSADGEIFLSHDPVLIRTARTWGSVGSKTSEELRDLDVGRSFCREFRGTPMPTLRETLDLVAGEKPLNIEIKGRFFDTLANMELVDKTMDLIREYGIEEEVMISAVDHEILRYVKQAYPHMKTGLVIFLNTASFLSLDPVLDAEFEIIESLQVEYVLYYLANIYRVENILERAQALGVNVAFWDFKDQVLLISTTGEIW